MKKLKQKILGVIDRYKEARQELTLSAYAERLDPIRDIDEILALEALVDYEQV